MPNIANDFGHGGDRKAAGVFVDLVVELPSRSLPALAHGPGPAPGADALLANRRIRRPFKAVIAAALNDRLNAVNDGWHLFPCFGACRFTAAGAVVVEPQH